MSAGRLVRRGIVPLVQLVLIAGLAVGGGALIAVTNSLPMQLAAVGALADVLLAVALTRAGIVLNAAWPIVAWLYLLGPLGTGLKSLGLDLSAGGVLLAALAPYPIFAAAARPQILSALRPLLPIALLAGLAMLSLAWSSAPAYGMSKLTLWLTTCVVPAMFIVVLARATAVSWRLIAWIGFAYVAMLIVFGSVIPAYPGRVTLFGANPIWVGRAAVVLAIVGAFGPFRLPIRLVLLVAGAVGAVLTASAGPMAGLVAGVLAGAAVALRARGLHDWRSLGAWLGLLGFTAMLLIAVMFGLFDPAVEDALRDPNNLSRPRLLVEALSQFTASPIMGSGFGGFAATGFDQYPHNMIAEVAGELGLLGLVALGWWILLALRAGLRSALLTALIVATLVFSLVSGNISGEAEFWFFSALAVGLLPATQPRRETYDPRQAVLERSLGRV